MRWELEGGVKVEFDTSRKHLEIMKSRKSLNLFDLEESRWRDLNPQPPLYESGALPLSYIGKYAVIQAIYLIS